MTQLVQLQHTLDELHDTGFEVFAVSNDPVDRLADFSARQNITFDLLSDEDSAVIRSFGILNTLIEPDEGKHMRWYGIPYPGTYIIDEHGVVLDKEFHQHHARRLSGAALLHKLVDILPEPSSDAPRGVSSGDDVGLEISLADATLKLEVITLLVCRIRVASGRHLYGAGAPDAFSPATLSFEGDGLRFGDPVWPESDWMHYEALGMDVPVHGGEVVVTVPVTVTSSLVRLGHGLDQPEVSIKATLNYQSCDELACSLPDAIHAKLKVPLEVLVEPEGVKTYAKRVDAEQANDKAHQET